MSAPITEARSPWRRIGSYRQGKRVRHYVDLWMRWGASASTMGWSDSFRVTDCWKYDGKWFHIYDNKETELNPEYITHWMPIPKEPK